MAPPVEDLDGLAELGDRGGLPGPGGAGDDQAGPAVMGGPVQVGQPPPGGDDVADRRGLHDQQPGVVGDPVIVVGGPLVRLQVLPDPAVQQLGNRGHLARELPPARQRGQRRELRGSPFGPGRGSPWLVGLGERVEDRHRDHLRQRCALFSLVSVWRRLGWAAAFRLILPSCRRGGCPGAGGYPAVAACSFRVAPGCQVRGSRGAAAPRPRRRSAPRWPRGRGCGGRGPRRARRTAWVPVPGASRTR